MTQSKHIFISVVILIKIWLLRLFVHPQKKVVNVNSKINIKKVLVVNYPHTNVPGQLKGGDNVVNQMIIKLLQQNSIECEELEYNPNFKVSNLILKKLIGMPYIFSQQVNSFAQNYDAVLVDAMVNFNIQHSNVISLFHFSFLGYKTLTGAYWKLDLKLFYSLQSLISKLGNRNSYNVAVSEFQKHWLNKEGIYINQVINNAVDESIFKPTNHTPTKDCLYLGGFGYYGKGIDVLEKLADLGLKIDCITNGTTLNTKLNFLPPVKHNQVVNLIKNYKVVIYPSRFESFGMVALEAFACGVPAVMFNTGLGAEIISNYPEFVFKDHSNIKDIKTKVDLILANSEKYTKLSLQVLKQFSYNKFATSWLKLFIKA